MTAVVIRARIKAIKGRGEAKDGGSKKEDKGNILKKKQAEKESNSNTAGT